MIKKDSLKPIKLHEIIGCQTAEWTDDMWEKSSRYVIKHISTDDAVRMHVVLSGLSGLRDENIPSYPYEYSKSNYIRHYRDYPPVILLGVFDLLRRRGLRTYGA